jgi:PAS domain S-box-containing protein
MNLDDNLPAMTWRARPDMSCEYVNRAWQAFTGYTAADAQGAGWARTLHPEDLARWLDAGVRAFDERRPFEIEYRLRRRDGEYRWVLDRAEPRFDGAGTFLGYAGVCIEIQDRRRPEALLSGVRVLVLDGDRAARSALVRPLEVAGADVRVAASTTEAVQALGPWRPDVVLAESNESFIRALRALPASHEAAPRAAQLAKPVEPVALLAAVARLAA